MLSDGKTVFSQPGAVAFGFSSPFCAAMVSGTSWKFLPTLRTEHMRWKGARRKIHASYQCITFMLEYQSKSLEELRHEDYAMGRVSSSAKGRSPTSEVTHGFGTMAGVFGTAGSFFSTPARAIAPAGGFSSAMGVFANSGFTYTVPGSNSFGTPNGIGSFGATPWPSTPFQDGFTMNSFRFSAFGEKNQNTGLFGQYKNPFSATGIFGAVSTQSANVSGTFGASTTVPNTFRLPPDFGLSPSANSPVISSAFGFMKAFTFGSTSQANAGLGTDLNHGQTSLFGSTAVKSGGSGIFTTGNTSFGVANTTTLGQHHDWAKVDCLSLGKGKDGDERRADCVNKINGEAPFADELVHDGQGRLFGAGEVLSGNGVEEEEPYPIALITVRYPLHLEIPTSVDDDTHETRMAGGIKENIDSEPEEIFLCMPKNKELYQKWIEAIRKPFIPCGPNLCCEDHSDLESDCQNWMLYKMVANQVNPKKDIAEYQGKVEGTNCSKLNNSDQRFKITTMRNLKGLCKRKEILQKLKFKCPIEKEGNDNDRASKELRCGQEKDSVVSISANTNKKIFVKDFAYNSASPIKQSSLDSLSAGTVIETNDGNAMTSSCAEIKTQHIA